MSQFGIFLVDAGVLIVLWAFVLAAVLAVRSDLRGPLVPAATRGTGIPAATAPTARPVPPARATTRGRPPSRLTVVNGARRGTTVELGDRGVLVGRAPDCSLTIPDDYISSRHARLTPQGTTWLVEDLGSTNGTFVNGARVSAPVAVHGEAEIRLGQTVLRLHR